MFDFTAYLFLADQQFVVFLHRWFQVSQWYLIYPLAMLHTSAWVLLKVGIFRLATIIVQRRVARHRAAHPPRAQAETRGRHFFRQVRYLVIKVAHTVYASAKSAAHGKSVSGYSLFWLGLTPLLQKLGDGIIGIRWELFGWRGTAALCAGASLQAACFCLLYSIYGKVRAEELMFWIILPLGVIVLLMWLRKNGRKKSA